MLKKKKKSVILPVDADLSNLKRTSAIIKQVKKEQDWPFFKLVKGDWKFRDWRNLLRKGRRRLLPYIWIWASNPPSESLSSLSVSERIRAHSSQFIVILIIRRIDLQRSPSWLAGIAIRQTFGRCLNSACPMHATYLVYTSTLPLPWIPSNMVPGSG